MKSTQQKNRLVELYKLRLKQAEARVVEQQGEVSKTLKELQERELIVANLDKKIEESWRFLEDEGETADAQILQAANRHRYWVDYDRQRESFYLQLTQEELVEKQKELKARQLNLAKAKAKQDSFVQRLREQDTVAQKRQQYLEEIEFADLDAVRRMQRVYQ